MIRWMFEGDKMKWETILARDINNSMKLGIHCWEEVILVHMGWIQARKILPTIS